MFEPAPSQEVQECLEQLLTSLKICAPVDHKTLRKIFDDGDFSGVVRRVRNSMNVPVRLIIRKIDSEQIGTPGCPAWIRMDKNFPLYGTSEFKHVTVEVFFRTSFLMDAPFEAILKTTAHEMAHIVLNSLWHPLRYNEKAVDITAMILGYREMYLKAYRQRYLIRQMTLGQKVICLIYSAFTLFRKKYTVTGASGAYLTKEEIKYVHRALEAIEKTSS